MEKTIHRKSLPPLLDHYGRKMRYLRISITDRCNLRCFYCRSKIRETFIDHNDILRYEEILRVIRIGAGLGVEKVRITGGEPLARKNCMDFLAAIRENFPSLSLAMTTNACLLARYAASIPALKLSSINISIDSFDRETFAKITGFDALAKVLESISILLENGIRTKLNVVAMKGITDVQISDFVNFAMHNPVDLRFIEFMPIGAGTSWNRKHFLPSSRLLNLIQDRLLPADETDRDEAGGPAKMYRLNGGQGRIGFISSVSNPFCGACDRLRLTPEGNLRSCLYADREYRLAPLLRNPGITDGHIARVISSAWQQKPLGENILRKSSGMPVTLKHMSRIGG